MLGISAISAIKRIPEVDEPCNSRRITFLFRSPLTVCVKGGSESYCDITPESSVTCTTESPTSSAEPAKSPLSLKLAHKLFGTEVKTREVSLKEGVATVTYACTNLRSRNVNRRIIGGHPDSGFRTASKSIPLNLDLESVIARKLVMNFMCHFLVLRMQVAIRTWEQSWCHGPELVGSESIVSGLNESVSKSENPTRKDISSDPARLHRD